MSSRGDVYHAFGDSDGRNGSLEVGDGRGGGTSAALRETTASKQSEEEHAFHQLSVVQLARLSCAYYFLLSFMIGFVFAVNCALRVFYVAVFPLLFDVPNDPDADDTDYPHSLLMFHFDTAAGSRDYDGGRGITAYLLLIVFSTLSVLLFSVYLTSAWVMTKSAWAGRDLLELKRFDFGARATIDKPSSAGSGAWDIIVSFLFHVAMPVIPPIFFFVSWFRDSGSVLVAVGSLVEAALWCAFVMNVLFSFLVLVRTAGFLCCGAYGYAGANVSACLRHCCWDEPPREDGPDKDVMSIVDQVDTCYYEDAAPIARVPFKPAPGGGPAGQHTIVYSALTSFNCTKPDMLSKCGRVPQYVAAASLLVFALVMVTTSESTPMMVIALILAGTATALLLMLWCVVENVRKPGMSPSMRKRGAALFGIMCFVVGLVLSGVCGLNKEGCMQATVATGVGTVWALLYLVTNRMSGAPFAVNKRRDKRRYTFTNLRAVWSNMWVVLMAAFAVFCSFGSDPDLLKAGKNASSCDAIGAVPSASQDFAYGVCDKRWFNNLTIVDAAYAAALAYDTTNQTSLAVDKLAWFGGAEWDVKQTTTSMVQLLVVNHHAPDYSVVAVRGSSIGRDWTYNAELWSEAALLQIFSVFIPSLPIWPDKMVADLVALSSGVFDIVPQVLDAPTHSYVQEIKDAVAAAQSAGNISSTNIVFVGHSLGGGLAKLVGTQLNTSSISFSGPGLLYTRRKFGLKYGVTNKLVTQVTPRYDPVAKIDVQQGLEQHINCEHELAPAGQETKCHAIKLTTCELATSCGDPRKRNIVVDVPGTDGVPCFRFNDGTWPYAEKTPSCGTR